MKEGGAVKILLIGDTHGMDDLFVVIKRKESPFDMLLHVGDVEESKRFYQRCGVQALFVRGNCDDYSDDPVERVVDVEGCRIYMTHGHCLDVDGTEASLRALCGAAVEKGADVVVFGHTHMPLNVVRDGVLILNPGSLAFNAMGIGPSYMTLEIQKGLPAKAEVHFV